MRGTVDGLPFSFRSRHGEWRVEIGAQDPWVYEGGLFSPDEVAFLLDEAFRVWRAKLGPPSAQSEVRRRLNAHIGEQREHLRRIDDATFTELIAHLRSLVAEPNFDAVEFLSGWLFRQVPSLGGFTPAEVLAQPGDLDRVKDTLGQFVNGVYV